MNACWLDVVFKISYKYQALAILLRTLQLGAQNIEVPGSSVVPIVAKHRKLIV